MENKRDALQEHENRIMNFAHVKDGWCYIYGDDGKEVDLNEFLAKHCTMGCDVEMFREQGCSECASCPLSALEVAAIQAAELREKVNRLEAENEALRQRLPNAVVFPIKCGDYVYIISDDDVYKTQVLRLTVDINGIKWGRTPATEFMMSELGERVFLTEESAKVESERKRGKK